MTVHGTVVERETKIRVNQDHQGGHENHQDKKKDRHPFFQIQQFASGSFRDFLFQPVSS